MKNGRDGRRVFAWTAVLACVGCSTTSAKPPPPLPIVAAVATPTIAAPPLVVEDKPPPPAPSPAEPPERVIPPPSATRTILVGERLTVRWERIIDYVVIRPEVVEITILPDYVHFEAHGLKPGRAHVILIDADGVERSVEIEVRTRTIW